MVKDTFEIKVGDKSIKIETTNWTEQASGSCLVSCGETKVLVTAVVSTTTREGIDFFPLTVEYEERFYAAGKILGSRFMKRESRPTDEAILTSRMIDRAIRPLFPEGYKKEVQVIITCLSWDGENDADMLGMIGASFALATSNIPWAGPLGAIRACKVDGEWMFNPTYEQREKSQLEFTFSAIEENGEILINMIELGAKETQEDDILEAFEVSKKEIKTMLDGLNKAVKKIGKEKDIFKPEIDTETEAEIKEYIGDKLDKAITDAKKGEKNLGEAETLREETTKYFAEKYPDGEKDKQVLPFFEKEMERIIIRNIIEKDYRPDGRKSDEIRDLACETSVLPRTHGSGVFHRGLTRVLSVLTLGGPGDSQLLEGMEFQGKKKFMHHYNFPPFSSGEVSPRRGPKRREIGHGNLAEKALLPVIPETKDFPYTIRIVSECVSSNGSTSMASTCAACIALLDAGVPLKTPVAGISIGLAKDKKSGEYRVLTDIQGPEDHYLDMDFKVAGSKNGITAIQMDVKISGIDKKIMAEVLVRAKDARLKILDVIAKEIPEPRKELSKYAPKIFTLSINPEKIGEVVGPKGSVINKIIDECGVTIDIEDDGSVFITGNDKVGVDKAVAWIKGIVKEIEVGEVFTGTVRKIMDFGAFVDIAPGQSGLVHISKFSTSKIDKVSDVVKEGDQIPVKVVEIDSLGRINLSAVDAGFKAPTPPKNTDRPERKGFFRR